MSKIIKELTKQDILDAINYLDKNPKDFIGRQSFMYDLVFNDKMYPPILVLSKANELKGGEKLILSDFNRNTEIAFKILKENGFSIVKKENMINFAPFLHEFISQSSQNDLSTKKYAITFLNTKVKASFGQGSPTHVPWISFLIEPNTTSKGIYPVYLYYKKEKILILAFGISETNPPNLDWNDEIKGPPIDQYFYENNLGKPFRYGGSYVYKVYDVEKLPSDDIIEKDLKELIEIYQITMASYQNGNIDLIGGEISFDFEKFSISLLNSNLQFNQNIVKRFIASLITKPFVILTGLAGSGKTKLAQSFIHWICESEVQYKIVPVGADWINREPLLGYPNGLKDEEYVLPDNGVLQLMITAGKEENQDKPFFLVLDEMNLSHVERYFADFLSIMESNDSIKLYSGTKRKTTDGVVIPQIISWPKNLFVIGTVNIDETTYMFSPKVLDRANVIEFRMDEKDLNNFLSNPLKVDLSQLKGQGSSMASNFLTLSQETQTTPDLELNNILLAFFKELKDIGAEFGYRSAFEIHLLFAQLSIIDSTLSTNDKIDFAVMQKLLPKLHGSRSKIVKSLEALMNLCLNDTNRLHISKLEDVEPTTIKYKVSFEKLKRMYYNAINNGFTSYAEA